MPDVEQQRGISTDTVLNVPEAVPAKKAGPISPTSPETELFSTCGESSDNGAEDASFRHVTVSAHDQIEIRRNDAVQHGLRPRSTKLSPVPTPRLPCREALLHPERPVQPSS